MNVKNYEAKLRLKGKCYPILIFKPEIASTSTTNSCGKNLKNTGIISTWTCSARKEQMVFPVLILTKTVRDLRIFVGLKRFSEIDLNSTFYQIRFEEFTIINTSIDVK